MPDELSGESSSHSGPTVFAIVMWSAALLLILAFAWVSYQRAHSPLAPPETGTKVFHPPKPK